MPQFSPVYDDLVFMSPLSEERAARLARFTADAAPSTILDIGCGWGELLLRTLASTPGALGLGIDLDTGRIEEARRRASARGLAERAEFEARDARGVPGKYDAVLCIGASQVWGPPVEAGEALDYVAALHALHDLLNPGGRLVYGEAVWSAPPTPAATAALNGRDDEYLTPAALAELAQAHGFDVAGEEEATQEEWDHFEAGFVQRLERWLDTHPTNAPETEQVRKQLRDQQDRYLSGYRGILGMAYLTLIAN